MGRQIRVSAVLAALWTGMLLLATSIPLPEIAIPTTQVGYFSLPADKIVHAGLFGGFAFLWGLALSGTRFWLLKVIAAGFGLGAATELVQAIPFLHRQADWEDLMADCLGVAGGLAIAWLIARVRRGMSRSTVQPAAFAEPHQRTHANAMTAAR